MFSKLQMKPMINFVLFMGFLLLIWKMFCSFANHCHGHGQYPYHKKYFVHMDLFVHWKMEILRFLENGWKYIQYSNYGFILWMFLLLSAMLKIHYVREKEFDADSESQSRLSVCLDAALLWYAYFMQSYTWMHAMLLYL